MHITSSDNQQAHQGVRIRIFLEKLIKARLIKIVKSFLKLLEPGTAAHYCKAILQAYR